MKAMPVKEFIDKLALIQDVENGFYIRVNAANQDYDQDRFELTKMCVGVDVTNESETTTVTVNQELTRHASVPNSESDREVAKILKKEDVVKPMPVYGSPQKTQSSFATEVVPVADTSE